MEAATRAVPTEEEDFWSFGSTDEPVEFFGGVTGEGNSGLAFTIGEGPVGGYYFGEASLGSSPYETLLNGGGHDPLPVTYVW